MDCIWMCCDDADKLIDVSIIYLGPEPDCWVTFGKNRKPWGKWSSQEDTNGIVYLCLEFAAGIPNLWKRHLLREAPFP